MYVTGDDGLPATVTDKKMKKKKKRKKGRRSGRRKQARSRD